MTHTYATPKHSAEYSLAEEVFAADPEPPRHRRGLHAADVRFDSPSKAASE